jgi:hypothetical protein
VSHRPLEDTTTGCELDTPARLLLVATTRVRRSAAGLAATRTAPIARLDPRGRSDQFADARGSCTCLMLRPACVELGQCRRGASPNGSYPGQRPRLWVTSLT